MKRMLITSIAGVALGALALLPAAPATAGSSSSASWSASVVLSQPFNALPNSCSFSATYTWSGFGGSNDTAAIWLADSLNGTVTGVFQQPKVRGASGSVSHSFDGLIPGVQYRAWGELLDGHGTPILGTLVVSSFGTC